MADKSERSSFELSSPGTSVRLQPENVFSGCLHKSLRTSLPRSRKRLNGDLSQEESQYASSYCLSSYYSVFVVRLAIMALLAILIGMLTILTWHITKVYTKKSLNSLAYGLRYELLQRPLLRMWNILNSTVEITTAQVKLSEYVVKRYTSQPVTRATQVELYEMMRDVTWALFASHKALNAITINYKNGFVQAFHRDHRSNNTFYIYSDVVNYSISGSYDMNMVSSYQRWSDQSVQGNLSAIWYRVPLDPVSGEKIGKQKPVSPEDLINIAGLSQVPDGVASWHVAVSKYTDSPLLSAALPVWDPSHQSIMAVVGATTALSSVGYLMKELVEVHSGHIYLTSQEGYLLATSTNAPLLRNSSTGPKLVMAVDSGDDVIRQGAQWLQRANPNKFPPNHEVHVENARLGDQRYYIDSFFLNLKRLPMVGVIIIPRAYIMGQADERAFKTLIILISASVCTLIIGCVCILILTNGVSKEMKLRAELINQLEARRRAEASSNYKSQFLANMSHELRTPMAAVIGLLDILISDDFLTSEQYATVTQIRKCSTALLRLLNNILDLSKVEAGKLVLEEAEFDLGRELEGLIDIFCVQCINHNIETVLDLSDDIPKLVRGDSARVAQIFANLISNSIKFTTSGHIVLRGWCEKPNISGDLLSKKDFGSASLPKSMQQGPFTKNTPKKDNKMTLWFEVDDTGCGIDPSKWETVFESFEQADPSTTRTHGGTGLGLCIVKTLVNKMGGEIKVVKKNGPGTLMQLRLLLSPSTDYAAQHSQTKYSDHGLAVLLALSGGMGRSIMSQWLQEKGVSTWRAADWNELTQILTALFEDMGSFEKNTIERQPGTELLREELLSVDVRTSVFVVVIDITLLDLSTNLWKEQLNFLCRYSSRAKFAWVLNHDTSSSVKMELRRKGHLLMTNRPLYKTKMIHILEAVLKERNIELQQAGFNASAYAVAEGHQYECLEIDSIHCDGVSSDDSDKSEFGYCNPGSAFPFEEKKTGTIRKSSFSQLTGGNHLVEFAEEYLENNLHNPQAAEACNRGPSAWTEVVSKSVRSREQYVAGSSHEVKDGMCLSKAGKGRRSLEGLRILLAEDTPVLQRVATIMLEKLGATVIVVGDGMQAVNALRLSVTAEGSGVATGLQDGKAGQMQICDSPPFDLILMDCQMPKMDGYEATKVIRKSELETGSHIPIVALTAHAMSSDEAKCLEVGMDAYLTKPIDCKLMASTILSLTRRMT
ncbi:Histidine kinase 1, variant 2 [Ancistrocladus abbreviatus]